VIFRVFWMEMDYNSIAGRYCNIFQSALMILPLFISTDARNYIHIDRNFGPDPRGDVAIKMNSENSG